MDDDRDPAQRFYAKQPEPPEYIDASLSKAEIFRIVRERVGSPLKVRIPFALATLGFFVASFWGKPPVWLMYCVAGTVVLGIASYYIHLGRARAPLWTVHGWLMGATREDPQTTRLEWVVSGVTIAFFLGTFINIAVR